MNTAEAIEDRVDCGSWRLGREIGRGAYGVVYAAANGKGERAAVKVCRRDDIGAECYERELRGAKLYSAIPPQEGLVHMREFGEELWGFYAVMDLADDEFGREHSSDEAAYRPKTLASVINGEKALPLGECVKLGISLAKGLVELQRHHLLHRDIKPGNVIYVGGRPVLSDPGLIVEESEAASLVGTPGYVPPENFTAAAGDVYSLGLTLKAASFGRCVEDLDKGPAQEADTGAKFFNAWWRVLNKATDPTPSRRYQSAKALLKDLESLSRKIALASIVGSSAARVAISLSGLAIIAILAFFVVSSEHMKEVVSKHSAETEFLQDTKDQMQLAKYIIDAKNYFNGVIKEAVDLYRINRRLCGLLQSKIKTVDDGGDKDNLLKLQSELHELRNKVRNLLVRLYRLRRHFEKMLAMDGGTRQTVEEKLLAAQKLVNGGVQLEKRIYEIGGMIYGEENWQPNQLWIDLGGDFGEDDSIYMESLLDNDQDGEGALK